MNLIVQFSVIAVFALESGASPLHMREQKHATTEAVKKSMDNGEVFYAHDTKFGTDERLKRLIEKKDEIPETTNVTDINAEIAETTNATDLKTEIVETTNVTDIKTEIPETTNATDLKTEIVETTNATHLKTEKRPDLENEIVVPDVEPTPNEEEFQELFDQVHRSKKEGDAAAAAGDLYVVQGDELLPRREFDELFGQGGGRRKKRAGGMAQAKYLWPNGIVYYEIHESLNGEENGRTEMRSFISVAMQQWMKHTCLQFVQATTGHRLIILDCGAIDPRYSHSCLAQIGYQREYRVWTDQLVCLGKGCAIAAVHEIGHALGLVHEQQRPDRDRYLTMNLNNVNSDQMYNFNTKTNVDTLGVPYDYMSVMHYPGNVFSKNGGLTMHTNDPSFQTWLGRREISPWDAVMINKMYNCPQQYVDQNLHVEEKS